MITVSPLSSQLAGEIQRKIDGKTKPLGALGALETLAARLCAVQETLSPSVFAPHIIVLAGDHGIAKEGVSAYPQDVTWQMVMNFLAGGAAINVFARQHDIALQVVDAGVAHDFKDVPGLIDEKVGYGTRSFVSEPAMSAADCDSAMVRGGRRAEAIGASGCNVIGFGEMGIGNTASAAAVMSRLCGLPMAECVGRGAGLDDEGLARKIHVLERAMARHAKVTAPEAVLATFGGFEMAMMCGAYLAAARDRMLVLVDGFIATAALLVAARLQPAVLDYCVFSHRSSEAAHGRLLQHLDATPLLDLGMRLGEGTGAAMAVPLVRAAAAFVNEMASFDSAGVSGKT